MMNEHKPKKILIPRELVHDFVQFIPLDAKVMRHKFTTKLLDAYLQPKREYWRTLEFNRNELLRQMVRSSKTLNSLKFELQNGQARTRFGPERELRLEMFEKRRIEIEREIGEMEAKIVPLRNLVLRLYIAQFINKENADAMQKRRILK